MTLVSAMHADFLKVNTLKDSSLNQGVSDVYVISWPGLDIPPGQWLRKCVSV